MFLRTRRVGRHVYREALESYRDPETGRPRHRCIARWRAERSFAEELGKARFDLQEAERNVAFWQGLIDRTVRPRFRKQIGRAPECAKFWRYRLDTATTHLAALGEAQNKGMPADDSEVAQAFQAKAENRRRMTNVFTLRERQTPSLDRIGALADKARALVTQNDPDAVRAGLTEIADALDRLGGREAPILAEAAD